MYKFVLTIIIILHLSTLQGFCVCPVNAVIPLAEVEKELREKLPDQGKFIQFNKTPSGYIISVKDDLIFDSANCIHSQGKIILNTLAQIMKESGRRWLILGHTNEGENAEHRIYTTSIKTNIITTFLTDKESCLINQLFPIGFGSIMPNKFVTTNFHEMHNRTDFIVEEFSLN